jgi:hypothetical protein
MQGILLTPVSENVLGGALGTDVINIGGAAALTAGVAFQLYTASVNYARNAPEGYNAVKDVRVSGGLGSFSAVFSSCHMLKQSEPGLTDSVPWYGPQ